MKRLLTAITVLLFTATSAMADFTIYAGTKPGSGFDQWMQPELKELRKHLDEDITVKYMPGARGRTMLNKWEKELRFNDPDGLAVSGGTQGSNWLYINKIEYDFENYSSIGSQLMDMMVGKRNSWNNKPEKHTWVNDSGLGGHPGR